MRVAPCLIVLGVLIGSAKLAAQSTPPATVATAATQAAGAAAAAAATSAATSAAAASGSTAATPVAPVQVITVAMPVIVPRLDPPGNLRLTNLSTRARVTPETPLITGFSIRGTTALTVLVRAAGPALTAFGLAGTVAAPRLRLHNADGNVISENAGWSSAVGAATVMATAGAFPFAAGSTDAALVATLAPGKYSAEVIAEGGLGGTALVEVYDVCRAAEGSRLSNVSTLGTVATGTSDVTSGFVLTGTGTRQYLVRGVGPGLTKLGVAGVLSDPAFSIYNSSNQQIAGNDDWCGNAKPNAVVGAAVSSSGTMVVTPTTTRDLVDEASKLTGAFTLDVGSMDAALVTTLSQGAYTVQMRGVGTTVVTTVLSGVAPAPTIVTPGGAQVAVAVPAGATITASIVPAAPGVALLEIYELP